MHDMLKYINNYKSPAAQDVTYKKILLTWKMVAKD